MKKTQSKHKHLKTCSKCNKPYRTTAKHGSVCGNCRMDRKTIVYKEISYINILIGKPSGKGDE